MAVTVPGRATKLMSCRAWPGWKASSPRARASGRVPVSASSSLSRMANRRSAAATPREIAVCTLVTRRSEGMMAIIAVISMTNWPASRRPCRASRAATHTIAASASAASSWTMAEAPARVLSTFMFRPRMRLARLA